MYTCGREGLQFRRHFPSLSVSQSGGVKCLCSGLSSPESKLWLFTSSLASNNSLKSNQANNPYHVLNMRQLLGIVCIILFTQQPCKVVIIVPFYRWGSWGPGGLSDPSKVIKLVKVTPARGILTQSELSGSPSPCLQNGYEMEEKKRVEEDEEEKGRQQ